MPMRSMRSNVIVALAAVLGIAAVGECFSWKWLVGLTAAEPAAKARHAPISALRARMLENFHGQTTNIFTAIPGFGMERMAPLYKNVPFEIPDLSTNEVEVEKEIVPPKMLQDAFTKSLAAFRDPSRPLPGGKKVSAGMVRPMQGYGPHFGGVVTGGLQLRLLDLVGLNNPDGPRVYSGGKAFEVQRMNAAEAKAERAKNTNAIIAIALASQRKAKIAAAALGKADAALDMRPLDVFEIAGVAELSQGKQLFVRNRGNVIRMLGALRAGEQCLKCHEDNKKGDLLGAFSYTFVDTNNSLKLDFKKR